MSYIPGSAAAQALILFALVLAMGAGILYLVSRYRGTVEENRPEASGLLTMFREMHGQGDLSDDEFRTIKTKLTAELQQQFKDSEDPD